MYVNFTFSDDISQKLGEEQPKSEQQAVPLKDVSNKYVKKTRRNIMTTKSKTKHWYVIETLIF